jgi:hypothetical protein
MKKFLLYNFHACPAGILIVAVPVEVYEVVAKIVSPGSLKLMLLF